MIAEQQPVDRISLVAELPGAELDGKIDPKAFAFAVPQGAEIVKFFVPPHTAQLLSKRVPDFKFTDLDGKALTPESLAGKVAVFDFWASWCGPCRESLPNLQKVYEKYKNNPKVAICAISVDQPKVENKELAKLFDEMKVHVPIYRDLDRSAAAFKFTGIPTMFVVGADGIVQDYENGFNPKLAEELPEKIEQLLAGKSIYEKPLKEYQEKLKEYAKMIEKAADGEPAPNEPVIEERKLPETKTAPRSEPAKLKLKSAWTCPEVKSPGNVLLLADKTGPARLAVVENWKSVAEIGLDGKLIAMHKLPLGDNEVIGCLRSAVGADGKRFTVAFLTTQQRCHVMDDKWNVVASYPEDALKRPHSGLADVELGDLQGDGKLRMYVTYWGVVGVQGVSLDGKRLWANRSLANVIGAAILDSDEKGGRSLCCANNTGVLTLLDAEGQRKGEIKTREASITWVVAADPRGDGRPLLCAMSSPQAGRKPGGRLVAEGRSIVEVFVALGRSAAADRADSCRQGDP